MRRNKKSRMAKACNSAFWRGVHAGKKWSRKKKNWSRW